MFLCYCFCCICLTISTGMVVTSMFTSIEKDWGITHTQSGLLISAVYWAIVILTFPVSILVDRWSRTKTIGVMAIMWSFATAICALTGNFVQLFHGAYVYRSRRSRLCSGRKRYDFGVISD
jgi:predicted MFS family arabinose efflux permease